MLDKFLSWIVAFSQIIGFYIYYLISSIVFYFVWNAVMPDVFGLPFLSIRDSFLLFIVLRIGLDGTLLPPILSSALKEKWYE
jgi:hypothetical protein